ncbi:MMPL family transporter [Methylomarinum sp. Ch1-1]|uniref:MMPL family transporter n=1 Tax=Methylomarinum roseum TaxID=3067653 RepID=A0AAU7NWK9_9GAMM
MKKSTEVCSHFLVHLANGLQRYPKTLILLTCLLCGWSLFYAAGHLGIDTDTTKILSEKLSFQQDRKRFIEAFPQEDQAILVVVETNMPEQTTKALDYLGTQFRKEKKQIESVYIPGAGDFFDRHGLLYLDLDELDELASKLDEAQPFIGSLADDNSLNGLLSIIGQAISQEIVELPADLNPLLNKIRRAVNAAGEAKTYRLSWQQEMLGEDRDLLRTQRFILLKPKLDFNELVPAEKSLAAVRVIVDEAKTVFPDVSMHLTGEVVLEHDELISVTRSAEIALIFSVTLVFMVLYIGLRSIRMVLVTLTVLLMGLLLTSGFAALAIGHLNIISIAFAVLYIGIGVDYTIQLCLRYRELRQNELPRSQALRDAVRKVGPSITLCALTTSAAFFSFIPTAYKGVSELGIISGVGIFISLLITLTVLPALLKLFRVDTSSAITVASEGMFPDWVYRFPMRHASVVRWTSAALVLAGLGLLTQTRFDFNPLNLRDPDSESVATFRELLKTKDTSPMTLTALAKNKDEALDKARKLKRLEVVENAITIFDYIPEKQKAKLAIIEDLSLVLGLHLTTFPPMHHDTVENNMEVLDEFKQDIDEHLEDQPDSELSGALHLLREDLDQFIAKLQSESEQAKKAMLDKLQFSLLDTLPATMNLLLKGLTAGPVTIDTLPEDLSERWLNKDGIYRIMISPSRDLNEAKNLREFVTEVRKVAPHATDLPVIYLESGNAVVGAFQQALVSALAAIILVLLIIQRSFKDALLILLPLMMTAILTGASTVVMNNPFNFANIIIIPLLFGLGVDGGIYIMYRLRNPEREQSVLRTSTARAVFFSLLTTLCSLVSMAFTPHPGLASMGQLLAIGLILTIVCTLIVLPAFAYKAER